MEWKEEDNQLRKTFTLESFSAITQILPKIAIIADEMDHHPDFEVFNYKNIRFSLSTHSKGKVTELDYELAQKIDEVLTSF